MTQPVIPSNGQLIDIAQPQPQVVVISGDEVLEILREDRPEDRLTVDEAYQSYLEERAGRYGY